MSNLPTFPQEERAQAERNRALREGREPDLETPPPYVGDPADFKQGDDIPIVNEPQLADAENDARRLGADEDEDYDRVRDKEDVPERPENEPNVAATAGEIDEIFGEVVDVNLVNDDEDEDDQDS